MPKYLDEPGLTRFYDNIADRPAQAFGTVAEMQAATYLEDGMTCHTNGFHAAGDGGAAYYTVGTSGTANGMDVLALQGGLFATLVYDGAKVNICQLGATDNADISPIVAYAVSYLMQNYPTSQVAGDRIAGGGVIEIPAGEYSMNSAVSLTNVGCVSFIGDSRGSTIINVATGTRGAFTALTSSNTPALWEITFDNLTFMGNTAFDFTLPHDVFIRNCRFYNIESPHLAIVLYLTVNVVIENCSFYSCNYGVYLASAGTGPSTTLTIRDCWFAHCKVGLGCAFQSNNYFTDMLLENCIFEYCSVRGINITGNATNVSDMTMRNCYFEGNTQNSLTENVSLKAYDNYFDSTEPMFVVRGSAGASDIVSEKESFSVSSSHYKYVVTSTGYEKDTEKRALIRAVSSLNISTISSAFNGIIEFTSAEGNYIGVVAFVQGSSNTLTKLGGSLTPVSNAAGTVLFDNTTSPMFRIKW